MKAFILQYWKILVGLIAIFIGGLGFGAVLESLRHRATAPDNPGQIADGQPAGGWVDSTIGSLARNLELSEEQQQAIRPAVEATAKEIAMGRESALIKFELSLLELHRSIADQLDPEQLKKLEESQKALEARIKRRSERVLKGE